MSTRLLLVGAGHTHLHVVTRAAELREAGVDPVVVAPPWFAYSGLGSATAGGAVAPAANRIDVAALCRRHGVELVPHRAVALDRATRTLTTDDGREHATDLLSLNVGSDGATAGVEVGPAVVRVKPLVGLAGLPRRLDELGPAGRVLVVGGGASAAELAANLAANGPAAPTVTVLARPHLPVEPAPTAARRRIGEVLRDLGVRWRGGTTVTRVADGIATGRDLSGPVTVAHDLAVLAVGLRPSATVAALGLADDTGHLPVDSTLSHPDLRWVLGAGDAARYLPRPLPKIGVFGVRAGPAVVTTVLARVRGETPPAWVPQDDFLAILDLAVTGVALRGGRWWEGRSALVAKRVIDRRWLARYR